MFVAKYTLCDTNTSYDSEYEYLCSGTPRRIVGTKKGNMPIVAAVESSPLRLVLGWMTGDCHYSLVDWSELGLARLNADGGDPGCRCDSFAR